MRFEPTFRSVRMRPADGPSNGLGTLSRIQSLADYTIAMLDLLEMLRALTLYPWLNTAEDEKRRVAVRWVLTHWKEYQDECARRREAPPTRARSAARWI